MGRIRAKAMAAILIAALSGAVASAETYKVAIIQLQTSGVIESLAKALAEAEGVTFEIQIVPSARAVFLIENNQVDIAFPRSVITDPAKLKDLKFDYSAAVLSRSAYVLYTNKKSNIDAAELKKGNAKGYKVETNASNVNSYEFKALPSDNIEASLKKIDAGFIDGYLYSQISGDTALKNTGLKSIKRQFYSYSQMGFTIKKGTAGGALDKILVDGMKKIQANGTYDKIMGDLAKQGEYNDWQP
jgi:ABC-type amino acid transport substrate-binding protein